MQPFVCEQHSYSGWNEFRCNGIEDSPSKSLRGAKNAKHAGSGIRAAIIHPDLGPRAQAFVMFDSMPAQSTPGR
jgi:hypothetical protein